MGNATWGKSTMSDTEMLKHADGGRPIPCRSTDVFDMPGIEPQHTGKFRLEGESKLTTIRRQMDFDS